MNHPYPHILESDDRGWTLIHRLACPGNLLRCELTEIVRQLNGPPFTGRKEVWSQRKKDQTYKLVIGDDVPRHVLDPTSRRTGHDWNKDAGITFGGK